MSAFLVFLLSCISVFLFSYAFPPWKFILYGTSIVLLSAGAGLFEFFRSKEKNRKRPVLNGIIGAGVFAAVFAVLTFLINNVILKATKSFLAAEIIAAILVLFFAVFYALVSKSKKKVLRSVFALVLAAVIGLSPLYYEKVLKLMEKPAAAPVGLSQYAEIPREKADDADFYISPSGSDDADGSFEQPFATFEKAKEAVAAAAKEKIVKVAVMAGEYNVSGLEFTEKDGGTEEAPVIYCAYGDGEVILNGGITLEPSSFSHITDENVKSRLSDAAAANVLCADLKEEGLTSDDWGKIYAIGSYNTAAKYDGDYVGGLYCELFVNDKRQTLARYPDGAYLYTGKVLETGYGRESDGALTAVENWDEVRNPAPDKYAVSSKLAQRIASWQTLDDVWMFGYWKYDWADASSPIGEFSAEQKMISPKFVSTYGTKEKAPYYFFNVFEELDSPGEWYLDRENGLMYVYPEKDIAECTVNMSITEKPVLSVLNADNIIFDGFTVKGTRGDGITVSGNNITVKNCVIKNVAGWALIMNGTNCTALSNEITRTGKGGISLSGGDRETLTPGENKAENNLIHDWSEIYQTYQAAVTLNGVGNICAHNEIYNSPHEAISYGGNNHVIEYNVIHDVCLLTDDGGAIYAGRRWDFYGNVIRYNCIYDLGSSEHEPCGIYLDDALSGQTVTGNLLINVPSIALHLGGGRDLTVTDNYVINTNNSSISYDARAIEGVFGGWFTHSSQQGGDMWQNLYDSPWQTDVWKEAYPQMSVFSDDFDNTDDPGFVPNPANSDVSDNTICNIKADIGSISDAAQKYSRLENNTLLHLREMKTIFADPDNGDYSLTESALADGYCQLPLSEMGRY